MCKNGGKKTFTKKLIFVNKRFLLHNKIFLKLETLLCKLPTLTQVTLI